MRTERLALRGKPHGNRRRMPSGGREPAEHGLLRRLLVEVKGLRIILFGETDDVVLRHRHWLALEAHADLQVVEPLDHCALASQTTPLALLREPGSKPDLHWQTIRVNRRDRLGYPFSDITSGNCDSAGVEDIVPLCTRTDPCAREPHIQIAKT